MQSTCMHSDPKVCGLSSFCCTILLTYQNSFVKLVLLHFLVGIVHLYNVWFFHCSTPLGPSMCLLPTAVAAMYVLYVYPVFLNAQLIGGVSCFLCWLPSLMIHSKL